MGFAANLFLGDTNDVGNGSQEPRRHASSQMAFGRPSTRNSLQDALVGAGNGTLGKAGNLQPPRSSQRISDVSGDSNSNNLEEQYSAHYSQQNQNQNSQNLSNQHGRNRYISPWHRGGGSPNSPEVHMESIIPIEGTFAAFCGNGHNTLDGKSFAKLVRDSNLVDKNCTATDVDLIFHKLLNNGQRRIDLIQFESGLRYITEKKGTDVDTVFRAVAVLKNPKLNATKAEPVRLHDDPNNSNQVMSRMDSQKLCRQGRAQFEILQDLEWSVEEYEADTLALEQTYRKFCGGSGPGLTGANFSKLCKDCRLFDNNFTASDADIIFSKSFPKGQNGKRYFTFQHFVKVLSEVAEKKAVSNREVRRVVAGSDGPTMQYTKADAVRFHDDTSTYTGTHAAKLQNPGSSWELIQRSRRTRNSQDALGASTHSAYSAP